MSSIDHLLVFHMLRDGSFMFPRKGQNSSCGNLAAFGGVSSLSAQPKAGSTPSTNQIGQLPCNHCNTIPWEERDFR